MKKCRTENALFSSEDVMQIRESTSRVLVCESRAHPVFNKLSGASFPSYAISVALARWNLLLHAAEKKITSLCLWSKIIGKASLVHHKFFSFKKRPNVSLFFEYSRTLIWFFGDFKFAFKTTKFYAQFLVRSVGQKHELQYLEEIAA